MKQRKTGTVVSDKMNKTRVVRVERMYVHPKYKKRIMLGRNYYAHDEENTSKVGNKVVIELTRPLSRLKRWRIVEIAQ
jgi:small subunit ribosomal protein S17